MNNFNCGIYCITQISSGKRYIGSSVEISTRIAVHKRHLRDNVHHSKILQRSFNKNGSVDFMFTHLLYCSKSTLLMYEQIIMDYYKSHNNLFGFNIASVAGSRLGIPSKYKGIPLSDEHKAKISAANKGKPSWKKGVPMSDDEKRRLSISKTGIPSKLKGVKTGCKMSEDGKRRVSESRKGKPLSDETKKKLSESQKGRNTWSKGCVAWNRGIKSSPSHKIKTSVATITQWAAKKGIPFSYLPQYQK